MTEEQAHIDLALEGEAVAILALARASGLPVDGLREVISTTLVARRAGRVAGIATLELYDDAALLRSVAVAGEARGQGLGIRLTEAAIAEAGKRGVKAIYLLTTTAEHFFPRFGFEVTSRDDVPLAVRQSVEFVSACPASAVVMVKRWRD